MTSRLPIVLPDTNFLLAHPEIHKESWTLRPVEILISETVRGELIGQSTRSSPPLFKARLALSKINPLLAQAEQGQNAYQKGKVTIAFTERPAKVSPPLEPNNPDHQLIALALQYLESDPPRFCAILTNDQELCEIAEAMSVLAVMPSDRENFKGFHGELRRKHEWWERSQRAKSAKLERTGARESVQDPDIRLERFIRHTYYRIRAARHRAILSVAPLRARLRLAIRIIQRVPKPEKRVILLVVESQDAAEHWARQIRARDAFSAAEIPVFGVDKLDRLEATRAIIYRYDQVGRRLPQHLARLTQAQQRLTAVVDGCDILDPVDLAQLLFECDQFIGLCRYPLGHARTPGNRMLKAFLRYRSLFSYSFADAECDGWGHPFDVYLHPVSFTEDERRQWDQLNGQYVQRRESAIRQYPELSAADDFWDALNTILQKAADPDAAQLIPLREEREQLAQMTCQKSSTPRQLIEVTSAQGGGRLVLDYNRQWTPALIKELTEAAVNVVELKADNQRAVWRQFARSEVDCLLLSEPPSLSLPEALVHQLIILTPLRPMSEISDMVDWVLGHTQTVEPVRIDLIYTGGTAEEVAVLELAEASFDLHYQKGHRTEDKTSWV